MYLYIYENFLNNKKFSPILTKIEARLNELDIKGKVCQLNLLKNLKEIISENVLRGVNTIIAVGDDTTLSKVINYSIDLDVVIGYIPIEKESKIATIMGTLLNEKSCDVIAQRIIKKLDLGKINNLYFLDAVKIFDEKVKIKFKNFEITPLNNNQITFCNIGVNNQQSHCHPNDGYLEAIITPIQKGWLFKAKKTEKQSVFPFTKIKVNSINEPVSITVDDKIIVKTPAEIEVLPNKLKFIVGSNRLFD